MVSVLKKEQNALDSYVYLGICVGTGSSLIHIGYLEAWYQDGVMLVTSSSVIDKTLPIGSLQGQ